MKKIKFDIKGFLNKKENMAVLAVAVIFCAGVAITNVKTSEIPLHDGDVLVDSQNVEKEEQEASKEDDETLAQQRADLELKRNDIIAGYDDTIKNSSNKDEQKDAIARKNQLSQYMEQEVAIEGMIASKKLPASMVIITEAMITVTVDEQDLKQDTVTKICNIVMEETGRGADKIIIQSLY